MIKVMLVDDEMMVVEDTLQMIDWEGAGFRVVGALTNAAEAWALYQRERPQIVIADICMPVMSGLELAKRIFATGDPVQVLLLSSHENFHYAKSALELGISRYLLKHELNGELLLRELGQAVEALEKAGRARYLQRQQQLLHLLVDPSRAGHGNQTLEGHPHWLLAFAARPKGERTPLTDRSLLTEQGDLWKDGMITPLDEGVAFLLPLCADPSGRGGGATDLLEQISGFQQRIGQEAGVLLYEVITSSEPSDLREHYIRWRQLNRYAFFLGGKDRPMGYRLGDLAKQCGDAPVDQGRFRPLMAGVERAVDQLDQEALTRQLGAAFSLRAQLPWNYNQVLWLAANLDSLCQRTAQQLQSELPPPSAEGAYGEMPWSDLAQMQRHYESRLAELLEQRLLLASSQYSRNLAAAIQFIHCHYHEDLSLDRVAAAANISGMYLSQLFKRETGQTFVEYLTTLRIEVSKKLLREENHKIYKVSQMVGFHSNQYFSQVFRKMTGISPLDYRDTNR